MTNHPSPLRYPGGKQSLAPLLSEVMVHNDLHDGTIVEPFAGGAGASLRLMFDEVASGIVLNDLDRRVYAFWRAVLNQTEDLVDRISSASVTMKRWRRCRKVYESPARGLKQLDLAFAV